MVSHLLRWLAIILLMLLPVSWALAINHDDHLPVNIAVDNIPVFFSPYAHSPLEAQYANLFFDPLLRWGKNQQLEKRLLTQWEIIKPGVMRFYLKKNIKFHSGNHLSSNDVIWTFSEIIKEPQSRHFFSGIKQIKRVSRDSFDLYSSLSEAQILDYLTHFFVLDARFYQHYKVDFNKAQSPISAFSKQLVISGSGPYQIKKYDRALYLDVVSNKEYWQGQAVIKRLNFIKIKSANSRAFALLADDVDICELVADNMLNTVNFSATKSLIEVPFSSVVFLTINDKKTAILKDKEIRAALNLAINKEGMLRYIAGNRGYISSLYSPVKPTIAQSLPLAIYDATKAKYLFGKVKMSKELTLLLFSEPQTNMGKIADVLVHMMKSVGIKLAVTEVSNLADWNKLFSDYDFTLSAWSSSLMASDNIYSDLFTNSHLNHYLDALSVSRDKDNSIAKQIVSFQQMQEAYRIIPLFVKNEVWASNKKYNVPLIFSANGIPYWHLLTKQTD